MKTIRPIVLFALTLAACGGDSPTSISSKSLTAGGQTSAQGNQNPLPVEPTGVCAGKETFQSVTGDVKYCVLSSDLSIQGGLCHFIKPEDPPTLRHKIGVVTGAAGAYVKAPIGFSAAENDCGAVPEESAGSGLILIEEADASGGAEIPPNSEKVLTFAFTRDAAECGRVQSVADLLTANGTSLKVAGFVLNYPTKCCSTPYKGSSFESDPSPVPFAGFKEFPAFTVPAGWTVTAEAFLPPGSTPPSPFPFPAPFTELVAVVLECQSGLYQSVTFDSVSGSVRLVQPFPAGDTCQFVIVSTFPPSTSYEVRLCPGLEAPFAELPPIGPPS